MTYYKVPLRKIKMNGDTKVDKDRFHELEDVYSCEDEDISMIVIEQTLKEYPGKCFIISTSKYREFITGRIVSKTVNGTTCKTPYNLHFVHIENFEVTEQEVREYLTSLRKRGKLKEYTSCILSGLRRAKEITRKNDQVESEKQSNEQDSINSLKARVRLLGVIDRLK